MSAPVCTIFHECPYYDLVFEVIKAKFGIVMYVNEKTSIEDLISKDNHILGKNPKNIID
jgi:hypothetical protein